MNVKKILSLLLALLLVGSMAACGNKPAENQNNNDERCNPFLSREMMFLFLFHRNLFSFLF